VMALMTTAALAHDETWTWSDFSYVDVMVSPSDGVDYNYGSDFSADYSAASSDCGAWQGMEYSQNSISLGSEYSSVIDSGSSYTSDYSYSGGYGSSMSYETEYSSVI